MDGNHSKMSNFQLDQRANFLALILLDALEDGNESDINSILARNNVDASYVPSERGISPLHYSCGMEDAKLAFEITRRFLGEADANVLSNENMTPLHVAAIFGRVNIVNLLLEHGARHDLMDNEGKTPMHYAIEECYFEVLETIRNHIFQHKYDRIRLKCYDKDNIQNTANNTDVFSLLPKIKSPEDVDEMHKTPINKVLCNVTAKDNGNLETSNNKATPNRVHYNYDVTSPYYINITHRRHRPQPIFPAVGSPFNTPNKYSANEKMISTADSESLSITQKPVNIFALTEKNLRDLSLATSNLDRSCISMIEAWRDKVQRSRARKSILKQYSNVEDLLEDVMKNDHLNFTNTVLQENDKATSEDSQLKEYSAESVAKLLSKPNLSLGTLIQQAAQAHVLPSKELESSYHTVPEKTKDNLNENDSENVSKECPQEPLTKELKSKINGRSKFFLQMTEAYVHTDDENGLVFYETKLLSNQRPAAKSVLQKLDSTVSTNVTIPLDYETDELRTELTNYGHPPGPITKSTKRLYMKRLIKYRRDAPDPLVNYAKRKNDAAENARFSVELLRTIRSSEHYTQIPGYLKFEFKSTQYFANHQNKHKMREGHLKQSFIYMLIDPRISCNLPVESVYLENINIWARFLHSVFYVGKGKTSRPYSHLYEAMKYSRLHNRLNNTTSAGKMVDSQREEVLLNRKKERYPDISKTNKKSMDNKKLERILDIWRSGKGVVSLHVFHNILPSEAYTREAAIIDAFGLQHLTNVKRGDYYGPAQSWTMKEKKYLGIALLHKAMQIYLVEGESQLSPSDLL
ncbi:uncharacterized protein [Eurosta solidaginis]|uniref:uncharacterized protein isoform X2 n=1 Tax=Eurosta solidaginis TaxID=178769 RepID=UPI003531741C